MGLKIKKSIVIEDSNKTLEDLTYSQNLKSCIVIPNGADLNTYVTPGTYRSFDTAVTSSLSNVPPNHTSGFALFVCQDAGSDGMTNIRQEVVRDDRIFVRHTNNKGSTWSEWKVVCNYAVGDIHITSKNENPSTHLGGKWELIDKHFISDVRSTDGTTFFTPASGIKSSGSYVMRDGHTLWIRQYVELEKEANDDGFNLGTFNLSELGVTDTYCSFLNQLSYSDGGNGGIVWSFTYDTGVVKQLDVFDKTPINSGVGFYLYLNFSVPMGRMLDSACDKFFWKRTE